MFRNARTHWLSGSLLALAGATAGAVTSLSLPSYYQSGAAFQAEVPSTPVLGGGLAGLASQVSGLQFSTQSNPQFLAELLTTDAVLRRVASARFTWNGSSTSLAAIYGYDGDDAGVRDFYTIRKLRRGVSVNVNIRTGVVRFSVEARTPDLAKAMAESTISALNEANIALRQARAAAERTFTSERAENARQDLTDAEGTLAAFSERNRAIANSPSLQMEESRLRRAVDMAQQVYVQLRLQEEQAAVQEVRNTPAISVIDPP